MDYHNQEIKQLKKHIEFLEFILQDLIYIATTITIDGECFYNIRGPCVFYQKNALKQIYKSERDGQRTEIVYNYPKMGQRCRGQNIFYQRYNSISLLTIMPPQQNRYRSKVIGESFRSVSD